MLEEAAGMAHTDCIRVRSSSRSLLRQASWQVGHEKRPTCVGLFVHEAEDLLLCGVGIRLLHVLLGRSNLLLGLGMCLRMGFLRLCIRLGIGSLLFRLCLDDLLVGLGVRLVSLRVGLH